MKKIAAKIQNNESKIQELNKKMHDVDENLENNSLED